METKKVIIVGGGIIGLATAYYLDLEGHNVSVIDKGKLDSGTSHINSGYLTPSHIVPMAAPGVMSKGIRWMFNTTSPFYIKPRFDLDLISWGLKFMKSCTPEHVKKSMKPFLIFGAGNVPVMVDKTADIKKAAESIVLSKSFDNSTSCSADSVIIVDKNIYSTFIKNLKANDVYLLNRNEQSKLDKIYYNKGMINNEIIAKNSNVILEKIGVKNNKFSYKLVAYEIHDFDNEHYIFDEKILPLVGIIPSKNIENAIELAKKILDKKGKGHSAGIYSKSKKNIMKLSMATSVSRVIVNQPHSQSAGGSTNNYLKSTLSLGCGTWGNNLINENLYLKDFCNTTKVVFKKK